MAKGLAEAGFFCAQVRANPNARQIWCRAAESTHAGEETAWVSTVDIVSTPLGDIQYVSVNLRAPASGPTGHLGNPDGQLQEVLTASVLRVWPQDSTEIAAAISKVRDVSYWPGSSDHDPRTPRRAKLSTDHAEYFVGEGTSFDQGASTAGSPPLTFIATTKFLTQSWPTSSAHALTPPQVAAPGLEAGGFDCYGRAKMPCVRVAGNQSVDYFTAPRSDDVVQVSVSIGGGINDDGKLASLADRGFPQGLTFLTNAVRPAIEQRLNEARRQGASFVGIIAGTVVVIDATPPPPAYSDKPAAASTTLTIGAPLVTGFN